MLRPVSIMIADCGTEERIEMMSGGINRRLQAGDGVILATHLGRPDGVYSPELSTATIVGSIAAKIETYTNHIIHLEDYEETSLQLAANMLQDGKADIAILQNARMDPRDQSEDKAERVDFAERILEIFEPHRIDWDNLPTAHREEAYVCELAECARNKRIPVVVSEHVAKELNGVDRFFALVQGMKKVAGIFGGTKRKEKISITEWFYERFPHGFTAAAGKWAENYLPAGNIFVSEVRDGDLSQKSIARIVTEIRKAEAIFHCGTPGDVTHGHTAGTYAIWTAIIEAVLERRVPVLICGGDTASEFLRFAKSLGYDPERLKITIEDAGGYISNAGGAIVAYITGDDMPGLLASGYLQ